MREMGLKPKKKRVHVHTTDSKHPYRRYENLIEGLEVDHPEQVWVSDITYVALEREFVYLAVIMDLFTRCVRGWNLTQSLDQSLTIGALKMAFESGRRAEIHHSDQGVQYAASRYVEMLKSEAVLISMADIGAAWQNGYAERLMRTIKEEEVELREYRDYWDAGERIGEFLEYVYNRKRIHSSLEYLMPEEFEAKWRTEQRQSASAGAFN
jgi:putative transposase